MKSEATRLAQCPRCGGEAEVSHDEYHHPHHAYEVTVKCRACGWGDTTVDILPECTMQEEIDRKVAEWNRRDAYEEAAR